MTTFFFWLCCILFPFYAAWGVFYLRAGETTSALAAFGFSAVFILLAYWGAPLFADQKKRGPKGPHGGR